MRVFLLSLTIASTILASGCSGKKEPVPNGANLTFHDSGSPDPNDTIRPNPSNRPSPGASPVSVPVRDLPSLIERVSLSFASIPTNGAAEVALDQPIQLTFTEDLPETLPPTLVTVTHLSTSTPVSLRAERSGIRVLRFRPMSGRWEEGAAYRFAVNSVTSRSGRVSLPVTYGFTTQRRQWSAITSIRAQARNPAIATDARGNAVIVWEQITADGRTDIHSARFKINPATGLGIWEPAVRLNEVTATAATEPRVAMGPDGSAIVVWIQQTSLVSRALLLNSTEWTPPITSAPVFPTCPTVSIDSSGGVLYTWVNHGSVRDEPRQIVQIASLRFLPNGRVFSSGTGMPTRVSQGVHYTCPQVAVNSTGNAVLAWGEATSSARTEETMPGLPLIYRDYTYRILGATYDASANRWTQVPEIATIRTSATEFSPNFKDPKLSVHLDDNDRRTLVYSFPSFNPIPGDESMDAGYSFLSSTGFCDTYCSYSNLIRRTAGDALFSSNSEGSNGVSFYIDLDGSNQFGIRAKRSVYGRDIVRSFESTPALMDQAPRNPYVDTANAGLELIQSRYLASGNSYLLWRNGSSYRINHFNVRSGSIGAPRTLSSTVTRDDAGRPSFPQFVILNPQEELLAVWADSDGFIRTQLLRF